MRKSVLLMMMLILMVSCRSTTSDEEPKHSTDQNDTTDQIDALSQNDTSDQDSSIEPVESSEGNDTGIKIIAAGTENWQPYQMFDEEGQAIGAAYEILEKILEGMDVEIETGSYMPFSRQLAELKEGDIDVFVGLYYNDQRNEDYVYTESFAEDKICVFVHIDNLFTFDSYSDLYGKIGAQPKGASFGNEFEEEKDNLTIREIEAEESRIQMLVDGEIDYYISAYYDVTSDLRNMGMEEIIVPLDKYIASNEVYFVISKHSVLTEYLDEINARIIEFKESGEIETIIDKYLTSF